MRKIDKEILLNILEERNVIDLQYFIEVLFPINMEKYILKEKLSLFKSFLDKLKKEENLEYICVRLNKRKDLKFLIVLNIKLSNEKLKNIWFDVLYNWHKDKSVEVNKKENLIIMGEYKFNKDLFDNEILNYCSLSKKMKEIYDYKLEKKIEFNREKFLKREIENLSVKLEGIDEKFNLLLSEGFEMLRLEKAKGVSNLEMYERVLELFHIRQYNNYIKDHKHWSDYLEIIVYSLKDQLKEGFNKIEGFLYFVEQKNKNILNTFLKEIKEENKYFLLWKNILLFFILHELKGENKLYTNQEIRIYLGELLLNLLSKKKRKYYLSDDVYELGTEFMFYFEEIFKHLFLFKRVIDVEDGLMIRVGLSSNLQDLLKLPKFIEINKKLPMVVQPVDWSKNQLGGYLLNDSYIKKPLVKKNRSSDLRFLNNREYDIINKLQKVKVKLNEETLDYVQKYYWDIRNWCFNTNESIEELTRILNKWKKLYNYDKQEYILEKIKKYRQLIVDLKNFEENFKWMIYFVERFEYFYYPYFLCFRGRINVESNVLDYQNSKFVRGLLDSSEKSILDINWFKIAFMRYKGSDLRVKEELIKEFDEIEDLVYNYEKNPEIWYKSEEPWQVLRYCIEYKKYVDFYEDYGNKNKEFETNLLISFDCTCSALQLISCLLKNDEYVEELNLVEKGKKGLGDIYIKLSKEFKEYLEQNTKDEELVYFEVLNKRLGGWQNWRKLLKKIFMTLNYGLSDYGIRDRLYQANFKYNFRLTSELINYLFEYLVIFLREHRLLKILNLITIVYKEKWKENSDKGLNLYLNKHGILFMDDKKEADLEQIIFYNKLEKIENNVIDRVFENLWGKVKRKKTDIKFIRKTDQLDLRKSMNAIRANLIHSYDALWLLNTLENFFNEGCLFILVIFDCVLVNYKDIDKIYKAFEQGLKTLFKNEDQLYNIFHSLMKKNDNTVLSEQDEVYLRDLVKSLKGDFDISKQNLDYFIFP